MKKRRGLLNLMNMKRLISASCLPLIRHSQQTDRDAGVPVVMLSPCNCGCGADSEVKDKNVGPALKQLNGGDQVIYSMSIVCDSTKLI